VKGRLLLATLLFLIAGSAWDTYVFVESSLIFCNGEDPYSYSNWPGAYIPGLGPMWIAYPPLVLFFWAPLVCSLKLLQVPLSAPYLWAIKLPSVLSLVFAAYLINRIESGVGLRAALGAIPLAAIFAHGMFDSITALFLLLSLHYYAAGNSWRSGLSYGLALASKQHALLALPALLLAWKKRGSLTGFVLSSVLGFALVLLAYGSVVGFDVAVKDALSVFLFHADRPPNGLGFGGFAVLGFYGDAFGGYAGNLADATLLHGSAVSLHSVVVSASVPAAILILIASLVLDPLKAVFYAYLMYILLSYVGAIQHMVVPALLLPLAVKDRKLASLFGLSFAAYALAHLLAFWDIFPMVVSPLFLKQFGLWLGYLARLFDLYLPSWDLALKAAGVAFTTLGLVTLLFATSKGLENERRFLGKALVLLYIIEMFLLIFMLRDYAQTVPVKEAFGEQPCAVISWENLEYPGRRMGDFLSPYAVPPEHGYFSLVMPIANEIASKARELNLEIIVIGRLDLLRSYEVSDLLSALIAHKVRWAWGVILGNESSYLDGVASAPTNSLDRLATMLKSNTPNYFRLGGVLGVLNATMMNIPPPQYPYPTIDGKPIVFVIPYGAPQELVKHAVKILEQSGYHAIISNVTVANLKGNTNCGLPFTYAERSTSEG